jgi:two-component system, LytTR family, sensor kinase
MQINSDIYSNKWMPLIGIPVVAGLIPLTFFDDELRSGIPYLHLFGISFVFTICTWLVNLFAVKAINHRFTQLDQQMKRLVWMVMSAFVLTALVAHIVRTLFSFLIPTFATICADNQLSITIGSYIFVFLIALSYEARRNAILYEQASLEKAELEREHSIHMLESLKNQVNPHFLFNSLNTLVALVREDQVKAEEFTRRLSSMYRLMLESQDKHLTTLESELRLAEHYIWLLSVRFGTHMRIEQNCSCTKKSYQQLPPLTIQLLIENAVKHNIASALLPLHITIHCTDEMLTVSNTLQPKMQDTRGAGIGIKNLAARYALLSGQEIEWVEANGYFQVSVPILAIENEEICKFSS